MTAFDAYVQAKYHGGTMAGGPTFTVIHDAETPLRAGYADSIAEFFRKGPASGTSAHCMVDPSKAIKQLPDNVVAYAAGPYANTWGWHLEQAGYASFTRDQWTTPDGLAQLNRVAACLREIHDQWGIPRRWMTDAQLRAAAKGDRSSGGMTTHQQIARVLGGTTHTDPEDHYPRDLLLERVLGTDTPATSEEDDIMTKADDILTELAALRALVEQSGVQVIRNKDTDAMAITTQDSWAPIISGAYWTLYTERGWIPRTWQDLDGNEYDHRLYMLNERVDDEILAKLKELSEDEAARAATS